MAVCELKEYFHYLDVMIRPLRVWNVFEFYLKKSVGTHVIRTGFDSPQTLRGIMQARRLKPNEPSLYSPNVNVHSFASFLESRNTIRSAEPVLHQSPEILHAGGSTRSAARAELGTEFDPRPGRKLIVCQTTSPFQLGREILTGELTALLP